MNAAWPRLHWRRVSLASILVLSCSIGFLLSARLAGSRGNHVVPRGIQTRELLTSTGSPGDGLLLAEANDDSSDAAAQAKPYHKDLFPLNR